MMAGDSSVSDATEGNEDELLKPKSKNLSTSLRFKWEEEANRQGSWSMVLIKENHQEDSCSLIFPPSHHENLHVVGKSLTPSNSPPSPLLPSSTSASDLSSEVNNDSNDDDDDSSSTTLFSPSDSNRPSGPDSDSPVPTPRLRRRDAGDVPSWVNVGLEVFYSKIRGAVGTFRFPVKVPAFTVAAMVVGILYFGWRRRRRSIKQRDRDRLVRIIREKDERIDQLLNQIARMNNVLLALQRVPAASNHPS
ncbi:uncharacterized protein [Coffea arabica]|uniref:Transmembrane protein n=1 Tax=Coffea arabica TaxID=13443 RepID=A0A6P6XJL1_COFAR|nr:uncharacterized protein LOC113742568 [Coffea arabica]